VLKGTTGGGAVSSGAPRLEGAGGLLREEAPITEECWTVLAGGTGGSCVSLAAPRLLGTLTLPSEEAPIIEASN